MKVFRQKKWKAGWFVGNFSPTALKTQDFEVCCKFHPKGEIWASHYHKRSTEINYLIMGEMTILDNKLKSGDVFIIYPNEIANPKFLEDCQLIVIKIPSIKGDKYLI